MAEDEYNARSCITAGELRAADVRVPLEIPDCAWVPRSSIQYAFGPATYDQKTKRLSTPMSVTFARAFQWVAIAVEQRA